jgi:hypothetical protein
MDKLKEILFETALTERDELIWMMQHSDESAEKIEAQRARFKTAYGIIEQADLEAEYEVWVEESSK